MVYAAVQCNVRTRIGGCLFFLLNKHFPKNSRFYKLFNRNTIKVSYSSMPNYDTILKGINKSKVDDATTRSGINLECNSQGICNKGCIAKNLCERKSVVYRATVHVNDIQNYKRIYNGMTEGKFKDRISKHYTDF